MKPFRTAVMLCVLSLPALGQDFYADYLSIGGGYFSAVDHSTSSAVDIGYSSISSGKILMADLHVKSITGTVLSVPNVDITSVNFSVTYGFLLEERTFQPYAGGGLILGLNGVEERDITSRRPELVVNDNVAQSFGIFGVAGLHMRVSSRFAFFVDGRYSFEYFSAFIEDQSEEFVSIGGAYLRGGIRITINSSEDL